MTFSDLLVATSDEKSDDELFLALSKTGIKFYRGSLKNVLKDLLIS